jgi:stress response protein YsnF
MASRFNSPEVPFRGAQSQVTGKLIDDAPGPQARAAAQSLPLEASARSTGEAGWVVRLPVRAEQVEVEKRVVVYEQVRVRSRGDHDVRRVTANIRREELRVDADGQL